MKKKTNKDIIIGLRPIIEAIEAGKTLTKIFIKKGLRGELFQECFSKIRENNIPFQYVPVEKLNRITSANHQGIIALISPVPYHDITTILPGIYESGKEPFLLILDGITDIRNFGAIARSAESAGVDAIIIGTKKTVTINFDAIKTSAGALNYLPVCRVDNLEDTLEFLKNSGITLFGATEKAEEYYYDTNFSGPVAIVMGAEDSGISPSLVEKIDCLIKIPMKGTIKSLNVSVACGIIIYEALKHKEKQKKTQHS